MDFDYQQATYSPVQVKNWTHDARQFFNKLGLNWKYLDTPANTRPTPTTEQILSDLGHTNYKEHVTRDFALRGPVLE